MIDLIMEIPRVWCVATWHMSADAIDRLHAAAEAAECDGRPQQAVRAYQRALHLNPSDSTAALNLGFLHKSRGRLSASRRCILHALGADASLRVTAGRLLDGGPTFGLDDIGEEALRETAGVLRSVLRDGDYGARAVWKRLGSGLYTGNDLLMLRSNRPLYAALQSDYQGCLLLLYAVGAALPRAKVESALGIQVTSRLLSLGLLLDCATPWGLLASPVQIFPFPLQDEDEVELSDTADSVLLATDFDYESLLP